MSSTRLGLIRCEHCGRQFNPHSGARHIPWCAKQQSENRKHKLTAEKRQALERYKWRISYRPTNQINVGHNQHHEFQQNLQQRQTANRLADLNKRAKKSSINSSTTLSSPSASSTNSIGTGSIISGFSGHDANTQRAGLSNAASKQTRLGKLKRSISSLTLTKQTGISAKNPTQSKSSGWRQLDETNGGKLPSCVQTGQLRTKSVNDLNAKHMDEIVESLTKRMDEIYAQNQLLLARFLVKGRQNASLHDLSKALIANKSSGTLCDSDGFDGQDSDNLVMCHHCKANCIEEANYCHKCGCKVRANTSSSSPG